jgi:hypothetical protein
MSEFALDNIDRDGPAFAGKSYHNPLGGGALNIDVISREPPALGVPPLCHQDLIQIRGASLEAHGRARQVKQPRAVRLTVHML